MNVSELRRSCSNCPWRKDAPREHWHPDHFTNIYTSCQDDGFHQMLCHFADKTAKAPLLCAGWLRVIGTNSIGVRLALSASRATIEEVEDADGPELFETFDDMLTANRIPLPVRNSILTHGARAMSEFDDPPAQRHSEESVAAAEAIKPHADTMRKVVLTAIILAGDNGLTDLEGMEKTKMSESYRPRRIELVQAGLVVKSGLTRTTPSGRKAAVWVLKSNTDGTLFGETDAAS